MFSFGLDTCFYVNYQQTSQPDKMFENIRFMNNFAWHSSYIRCYYYEIKSNCSNNEHSIHPV